MRITTARRLSQGFFLALFLWFSLASSLGEDWFRLRGWPVNLFLELDPLVGLATLLATGTLYAGLLWGLLTLALTLLFGRFFCGWVCPFGALHQIVGWLGSRSRKLKEKLAVNRPSAAQGVKYYLLAGLLAASAGDLLARATGGGGAAWMLPLAALAAWGAGAALGEGGLGRGWLWAGLLTAAWWVLGLLGASGGLIAASLQTGLLDPIPLAHRSLNLFVLPTADGALGLIWPETRHITGGWLIAAVFLAALFLNLLRPRFYCRYVCPLGALFGLLTRFSLFHIGRKRPECRGCLACSAHCEGACRPEGEIVLSECVLCLNCFTACPDAEITYHTGLSQAGEKALPDLTRRGVVVSLASGFLAVPGLRLAGEAAAGWPAGLIRPPGSLAEEEFLRRCLKCGQCMRVCPTGVLQPAGLEHGLEALWTPSLNMRLGTSGCQLSCTACGQLCPTAAIRPISLDEKLGRGEFAARGPIRLGTAFLDRGRCLPWAMHRPCIVCQENCPVSPKAIQVDVAFETVARDLKAGAARGAEVALAARVEPGVWSGGDYYCSWRGGRRRILDNDAASVFLEPGGGPPPGEGDTLEILVRLQRPRIDPARCIGCGVCEHECPVGARRAIRVTAENETRNPRHRLLAGRTGKG